MYVCVLCVCLLPIEVRTGHDSLELELQLRIAMPAGNLCPL